LKTAAFFWLSILAAHADVIDRVAVIVGREVITARQVELEARAQALMEGRPPNLDAPSRRAAAERLVDRALIRAELSLLNLSDPREETSREEFLSQVNQDRFANQSVQDAALREAGLTREQWTRYLSEMFLTLRLVELRFRPAVQLGDEDVQDYYEFEFVPDWRRRSQDPVPSLDENRRLIEQAMVEARVNQALSRWLNQGRIQTRIRFLDEAFQ
jgi:parvulin-like peptidyl-prolyl isomerase